jgi:hypothetical protein
LVRKHLAGDWAGYRRRTIAQNKIDAGIGCGLNDGTRFDNVADLKWLPVIAAGFISGAAFEADDFRRALVSRLGCKSGNHGEDNPARNQAV